MKRSVYSALVALSLAAVPAVAQVAPTTGAPQVAPPVEADVAMTDHEAIVVLLSGYHGIPEAQAFVEAAADPAGELLWIATAPDESPILRDRALAALAYFPSDVVEALYASILDDPETPEMVRHRVIGHYATAFGDGALPAIAPYLDSTDVQLRLTAAYALRAIDTPAALHILDVAAARESDPLVLQQLQRQLTP